MTDVTDLTAEAILTEATRRTGGLDDLGDGPFEEPLDLVLRSLRTEADLNDLGHMIARERMLLHTVNRLGYVHDRATDPTIVDQAITEPVFIIGMPRSGSSLTAGMSPSPGSGGFGCMRTPVAWNG